MGLEVMLICEFVFFSDIFGVRQKWCSFDKARDVTMLALRADHVHTLCYITRQKLQELPI